MPKTLRIFCSILFVILIGCSEQSEVTVSTALSNNNITKVDLIEATTSTTSTTSTTTTSIVTTTILISTSAPETTTTTSDAIEYSVEPVYENWPWDIIAECESGSDWESTKGHYEGGLQFDPYTWRAYVAAGKPYGLEDYPIHAYDASREMQIIVAIRVRDGIPESSAPYLNSQGYGAWPTCRHRAGV